MARLVLAVSAMFAWVPVLVAWILASPFAPFEGGHEMEYTIIARVLIGVAAGVAAVGFLWLQKPRRGVGWGVLIGAGNVLLPLAFISLFLSASGCQRGAIVCFGREAILVFVEWSLPFLAVTTIAGLTAGLAYDAIGKPKMAA